MPHQPTAHCCPNPNRFRIRKTLWMKIPGGKTIKWRSCQNYWRSLVVQRSIQWKSLDQLRGSLLNMPPMNSDCRNFGQTSPLRKISFRTCGWYPFPSRGEYTVINRGRWRRLYIPIRMLGSYVEKWSARQNLFSAF